MEWNIADILMGYSTDMYDGQFVNHLMVLDTPKQPDDPYIVLVLETGNVIKSRLIENEFTAFKKLA